MRSAVDLLGADHVLMGTDWPIVEEKSVPERLQKAFAHCGIERRRAADDRRRQHVACWRRLNHFGVSMSKVLAIFGVM